MNTNMTIQTQFEDFHMANPHIYTEIVSMAREWKKVGKRKLGIGMVFEVLRWNTAITTKSLDFKLNNNYRSRYVRLIEEQESDLVGIFRTRVLQSA
jgi:hypothetical protein